MKCGCKGKGVLIRLIADYDGMPLSACSMPVDADEGKHVQSLPEGIEIKTGRAGRPAKKPGRLAADKGYDLEELRKHLRIRGFSPAANSEKEKRKGKAGKTCHDNRAAISN